MSRQNCIQWMASKGYPTPPRSACYFCPFHNDNEWRRLRDKEPQEFERAIQFEIQMQTANKSDQTAKGVPFLHSSCKPLDQVDFSTEEERGQLNFFEQECIGLCGV